MTVRVTHEPDVPVVQCCLEQCCRCFQPTPYWYTPFDVALCQMCAALVTAEQLPTKRQWCDEVSRRDYIDGKMSIGERGRYLDSESQRRGEAGQFLYPFPRISPTKRSHG